MISKKERLSPSIWTENALIKTENCVVALLMTAAIIFGSLVQQVLLPLYYNEYLPAICASVNSYTAGRLLVS